MSKRAVAFNCATLTLSVLISSCSGNSFTQSHNRPASTEKTPPADQNGQNKIPGSQTSDQTAKKETMGASPEMASSSDVASAGSSTKCLVGPVDAPIMEEDLTKKTQIGTVLWRETKEESVQLMSGSATYSIKNDVPSGAPLVAKGSPVLGDTLPVVTTTGWHLDVQLLQGFSSQPTNVAWLGVTNANASTPFVWGQREFFTGWYWWGVVWTPPPDDSSKNCVTPLNAGIYRIAMRIEANSAKIYFRKRGEKAFGPYPVPAGDLRLMMLPQGGYKFPAATLLNSGAVYSGGGGLF